MELAALRRQADRIRRQRRLIAANVAALTQRARVLDHDLTEIMLLIEQASKADQARQERNRQRQERERWLAERRQARQHEYDARPKIPLCLKCERPFDQESKLNRICKRCKGSVNVYGEYTMTNHSGMTDH